MNVLTWLKGNKVLAVAYVVYIAVFWFIGGNKVRISPAAAYFGLVALHLLFFYGVWLTRKIFAQK